VFAIISRIAEKISYLAIGLAAFLLVYNMIFVQIYSVAPTDLGLAGRLPMTFWIGLAIVGIVWFIGLKSIRVLAIALVLTVAYLFVAPAVIRVPVWLSNSYYPFGESVLINSSGHLIDYPSTTLNSYHYWPSFLYFASEFLQVTGIPQNAILKYFPLLIISMYVLLVFLILKLKLKVKCAILGAGLFSASFWLRQQYFGPPGIGYIFFLLGVLIISQLFFAEKAKKTTLAALFILIFIVATFTHALSSLMLILVLLSLFIARRLKHEQASIAVSPLLILCITFFLSYNMFIAPAFFNLISRTYYNILSLGEELGLFKEPSRVAGSAAQILNYRSTLGIMLIGASIALVGLLLTLKKGFSRKRLSMDEYPLFWAILSVFLIVFAFSAEYGSHEAYQRAFMFGLVPLSYFCAIALSKKPKLFPTVILLLLFLNIPAQYGADSYTLVRNPELSGAAFFAKCTPQKTNCFYDFSLEIRYYNPMKQVKFLIVASLPFTTVPNASSVNQVLSEADYVIVSDKQNNYYYYFLSQNPLDQVNLDQLNRLYDNSAFVLFRQANKTLP
jgi:hypothetical protein